MVLPCDEETAASGIGDQQARFDGESDEFRALIFVIGEDYPHAIRMSPTKVAEFMMVDGVVPHVLDSRDVKMWINQDAVERGDVQMEVNDKGESVVVWEGQTQRYKVVAQGIFASSKTYDYDAAAHRAYKQEQPPFGMECEPLSLQGSRHHHTRQRAETLDA